MHPAGGKQVGKNGMLLAWDKKFAVTMMKAGALMHGALYRPAEFAIAAAQPAACTENHLAPRSLRHHKRVALGRTGAEREPVAAALPAIELKPVDLRPTLPLPPICNLPRSSGADREDSLKVPPQQDITSQLHINLLLCFLDLKASLGSRQASSCPFKFYLMHPQAVDPHRPSQLQYSWVLISEMSFAVPAEGVQRVRALQAAGER